MDRVDPEHDHEPRDAGAGGEDDLRELPIDPADSLKRDDEADMPGLDPTPPVLPPD